MTTNAFNDFVQAILDSGLAPDKAAVLIGDFIAYRSMVKAEVRAAEDSMEYYVDLTVRLNDHINELSKENARLAKDLCAAKSAAKSRPTITIVLDSLFGKADELQERWIDFIKWVRNEGVVLSDGERLGLYEAKYIAEYTLAYFDYRDMTNLPCRGEEKFTIDWDSNREELQAAIAALLKFNLPAYELVWE